jgi:hypothetical protein
VTLCSANVGGDPVNGCEQETLGVSDYCQDHASADDLREQARVTRTWSDPHDCDDIPCPTFGDDCPWQVAGYFDLLADEREAADR